MTKLSLAISTDYPTVPVEARIMSLLNRQDNEAILYLRALRTVLTPNEEGRYKINGQIWRYYLEAAPHGTRATSRIGPRPLTFCTGDLERLRIRYRAWG
jgi:hypothetical protein